MCTSATNYRNLLQDAMHARMTIGSVSDELAEMLNRARIDALLAGIDVRQLRNIGREVSRSFRSVPSGGVDRPRVAVLL